jgi:hypothetical protein
MPSRVTLATETNSTRLLLNTIPHLCKIAGALGQYIALLPMVIRDTGALYPGDVIPLQSLGFFLSASRK